MKIIEQLFRLQELELGPPTGTPAAKREAETLRAGLLPTVLGHYERLVARGKKAVALVRRGVCGGCQMQLPSGLSAALLRDDDLCVCENCARYLKLAPPEPVAPPTAPKRPARRRRAAQPLEPVAA
jgi:hypothetical protein